MKAAEVKECLEIIREEILKIKSEVKDPYVIVGGDMNNFSIDIITSEFHDLEIVPSPPTRGNATLDICASTIPASLTDSSSHPPLSSSDDVLSDHKVVVIRSQIVHKHEFRWLKFRSRQISPEGITAVKSRIVGYDWEHLINFCQCPDELTKRVHSVFNEAMDRYTCRSRREKFARRTTLGFRII